MDAIHILVFAKAPVAGEVKTRLIPTLGAEAAARLHCELMLHTLHTVCTTNTGNVELWCAPDTQHPWFAACKARFPVTLNTQQGVDLGERMLHAATTALHRAKAVILVGTDCPTLCAEDLHAAQAALLTADAVLGPAADGGYWLLGLRHHDAALFRDIEWGSEQVLAATRQRLHTLGWTWRELATRWDVDRPEDLERLQNHRRTPQSSQKTQR